MKPLSGTCFWRSKAMMDVVYLGLTVALVAGTWGLVRLFDRVA
ncbi:MAG TPA: hypothetical protein VHE30_24745 [Polyangiaceae bacterium]|nr:hypothetical protein [Polyangiaceae bacterium]